MVIKKEMHAHSSSSVVVCHPAGRTRQNAIPVTMDRQSFPAYPGNSWMSQLLQEKNGSDKMIME
jgi:hypothetical protein